MRLLLIRHAAAVDIARSDAERELTPAGMAEFAASVRGLKTLDLSLTRVLHSPYLRAAQTAELCRPLLSNPEAQDAIEPCEELADVPSSRLLRHLTDAEASIALVGHEPWMSELLARLTVGDVTHAGRLGFRKGSVAVLQGEPKWGEMSLHGFFPPGVTRALGEA
ncbi:MAG: phosphohistidine phosphatase [Planctomycetota bacterium]|jgi:phosphohistidine phosphatase